MAQPRDDQFPRRLPYPAPLRPFKYGFSLIAGGAVAFAVATDQVASGCWTLLGSLALVHATEWYFTRPFGGRSRDLLQRWAAERYEVYLSNADARTLSSVEQQQSARIGDWCSKPLNTSFQNEAGDHSYIEIRLAREGSRWFLYSPDYGEELPHAEVASNEQEQDLSIALSPLMGEVLETGGMFFLNRGGEEEVGRLLKVTDDNGQDIVLLWSDQLRAELWRASTAGELASQIEPLHITGEGLIKELLPRLEADGVMVGLNWGAEAATAFSAETLRIFLSRYF